MSKLVLVLLLIAAVYGGARHLGYVGRNFDVKGPPGPGQTLVAELDGFKATFTMTGPAEETYMLFGGTVRGNDGAWLSGIELAAARTIARRHPDFHRCDSPGALEAMKMLEDLEVLAADRQTLVKAKAAVKEFEERMAGKGERLCTSLRGQWLALEKLERGETVISAEQYVEMSGGRSAKRYYLYVQSIDALDCKDSL